ncbi:hypothetical protein FIBSPDRAFT_877235, partial [Athelia psychrophila]
AESRRCSPTLANPDMMDAQPSAASRRPVCPRTKLTFAMRVRLHLVPTSAHRHSHAPPPIPIHICHVTAHDLCQHRPEDYPRAAIL